ncbi:hypothetical protein [Lysinibacillus fusiformis]|uniref:hypothetical protein n=1 Tax=Lysinibacillus fusiformis TaxID=28031 RepID=UPI002E1E5A0B|nr:hypothetical protein [Lysinibacillus fusiformis]
MQAVVEIDEEMVTILHQRWMPYIAFAKLDEELSFAFLSRPQLHKYFPMRKCLEAVTLNKLLDKDRELIVYLLWSGRTLPISKVKLLETSCFMLGIDWDKLLMVKDAIKYTKLTKLFLEI